MSLGRKDYYLYEGVRVFGRCNIGAQTIVGWDCILGHPITEHLPRSERLNEVDSKGCIIGSDCIIRARSVIYEDVIIGDGTQTGHNVVIREGSRIGKKCGIGNLVVIEKGVALGDFVRIQNSSGIVGKARIGNYVFIGANVRFTDGRFMTASLLHSQQMSEERRLALEGQDKEFSVQVQDYVRIGSNVTILAGVTIAKHSIIAAGALVDKDVPENSLVAGYPGRIIKKINPEDYS